MSIILKTLISDGKLKKEEIDFSQVEKVILKAKNDLKSAKILRENFQIENAFELAYEAMLSSGRALAFLYGVRPRAQGSHLVIVEFLESVVGVEFVPLIKKLDKMRKKRHYLVYGIGLLISSEEIKNAIIAAEELIFFVVKAAEEKNPQKKLFKK